MRKELSYNKSMTGYSSLIIDGIIRKASQDIDTIDFESHQEQDEFVKVLEESFKYFIKDLKFLGTQIK